MAKFNFFGKFDEMNTEVPRRNPGKQFVNMGWKAVIPHFIGAIFGCAAARLFELKSSGYIALALIFAFIFGVYKSCSFDKNRFIDALMFNTFIMLIFGAAVFIGSLIFRR